MNPLDETFSDSDTFSEDNYNNVLDLGNKWDSELNKIYKIVMDKLTADQKNELKAEEKRWLQDLEKSTSLPSSAHMENAVNFYEMTKERTYYLVELNSKIDEK